MNFNSNGLLDEEQTQERVEGRDFESNGLLADEEASDTQATLMPISGDSYEAQKPNGAFVIKALSGLEAGGSDGGFEATGLLDTMNDEDDLDGLLDEPPKSDAQSELEELMEDSQGALAFHLVYAGLTMCATCGTDEMPSLTQLLHPNGRAPVKPSYKGTRTPPSLLSGLSSLGSVTGTTFDGKTVHFKKKPKIKSRTVSIFQLVYYNILR